MIQERFSDLDDEGTPKESQAAAGDAARRFHRAALRALSLWDLRAVERDELLVLMGQRGATERLVASSKKLRLRSNAVLTTLFSHVRETSAGRRKRRFWNASFLGPLINEYRPELDLDAYRQVVDRMVRAEGLNAVFSIELQALTNYPQKGEGRSFLLNAHALAWSDDPEFSAEAAQERLSAREGLFSEFGAKTVLLTPRTMVEGEIEYLAHYLTKAPATGKYRRKDPQNSSRWKLSPVAQVRSDLQLRLLEILSHLEFTDLVWGVKGGTKIRSQWKQELSAWNAARCRTLRRPLETDFDVGELWSRVRARDGNGSRLYQPPEFYGPRPRPVASEAMPRHDGARLWPSGASSRRQSREQIIDDDFFVGNERLKGM